MPRTLTTTVNGTIVTGRYLHHSNNLIEIELTMPDPLRLRTSWAVPRPTTFESTTSVMIIKSTKMLAHLYEIATHLQDHKDQIIESYAALQVAVAMSMDIEKGVVPDALFESLKQVKRMAVVVGVETEVEHHDLLVDLRVGHSTFTERKAALTGHWFRYLFRREVEPEIQEQVIMWINEQRAAMAG
jgi:hypothetical protein